MRPSDFDKSFDRMWKFNERFAVFVGIMVAIVFVMAIYQFAERRACKHPRYVRGTECYDNGDRTVCKEALIYDGCND